MDFEKWLYDYSPDPEGGRDWTVKDMHIAYEAGQRDVNEELLAVLKRAQSFINNGIKFGFITMPDKDLPDPAHEVPPMITAAIAKADKLKPRQWMRDGVPIPGATGETYELTADDVGCVISYE